MALPFKLGLGAKIGSGKQAFSLIHIKDLLAAFDMIICDEKIAGPVNMTSPKPTTNSGLTKALGSALNRPAFLKLPEFALRLVYGEGASVLTSGQYVIPEKLQQHGFKFQYPDIQTALSEIFRKK